MRLRRKREIPVAAPPPSPSCGHPVANVFLHREALILFHKGQTCSPDFDGLGLSGFDAFSDMYALVSVDTEHASEVSRTSGFRKILSCVCNRVL